jgi:hypothetical protein
MISSWLGGWAYDAYGTHWIAFGSAGALLFVAAATSLRLPVNGWAYGQGVAVARRAETGKAKSSF